MNNFARTDAGFNRQIFQKGNVSHKQSRLNPMLNKSGGDAAMRHFSPQNQRARQSKISELKLEKHPASSELVMEG